MFQADGDVVEVADGVGTDRLLDGTDGLPAGLNTFDEVAAVIRASGQANLVRADCCGQ